VLPVIRKAAVIAGILGELGAPPEAPKTGYGTQVEATTREALSRALFGLVCVLGRSTAVNPPAEPPRSVAVGSRGDPVLRDLLEVGTMSSLERRCIVLYRRGARRGVVVGSLAPLAPSQGTRVLELLRRLANAQEPVAVWVLDGLCGSGWTGECTAGTLRDIEKSRLFTPQELHRFRAQVRVHRARSPSPSVFAPPSPRRRAARPAPEDWPDYRARRYDDYYDDLEATRARAARYDYDRPIRSVVEEDDVYYADYADYDDFPTETSEEEPTFSRAVARFRAMAVAPGE